MKIQYPLIEHFNEIKLRILFIFICFLTSFVTSYLYSEELFYILSKPLIDAYSNKSPNLDDTNVRFIFTDISEAFLTYIRISIISSLILTAPYIVYQAYSFFRPGIYKYEKSKIKSLYLISILLMILSICLSYYIILPKACNFFISYESSGTYNLYNIELEAKI